MIHVQPGGQCRAWLVGHFTAAVEADAQHLNDMVEALQQNMTGQPEVRVATVHIHPEGPMWRGCLPGTTTILVLCGRCGSLDYLPVNYDRFGNGTRWKILCDDPISITPSAMLKYDGSVICHYSIANGLYHSHTDSQRRPDAVETTP